MIELAAYLAGTIILLLSGYLVSVFSNAVYIDPEDIPQLFPDLSPARTRQLVRFTSNPRAFFQIALSVRVTSALGIGILALRIAGIVSRFRFVPDSVGYIVVFLLSWLATVILFVYLPRRVLPQRAQARLVRLLPLLNLFYLLSSPVMAIPRRLSGKGRAAEVTEEEKDDIVERAIETLAESAGISAPIIEEDEKEMIHSIFQLDVTEAEEIMVPRVGIIAFPKETDLEAIRGAVREFGYSRYPVYDGTIDNIIGIIPVKDLLSLGEEQRRSFRLIDHIREPLRIGEHKKIDQLLAEFKKSKTHMAIVIDEFGGTAGLVTLEDILEEIVGDIEDEHDSDAAHDIVRLDNGHLIVSGACPLKDLAEEIGIDLELDEFQTVGGLIYDLVGSVPAQGAYLNWENARLKVLEIEGQRIKSVLVIPPAT